MSRAKTTSRCSISSSSLLVISSKDKSVVLAGAGADVKVEVPVLGTFTVSESISVNFFRLHTCCRLKKNLKHYPKKLNDTKRRLKTLKGAKRR